MWIKLAICALAIGVAGPELARSGDIIADKTGVSQSWIGLILLATATSLPELMTGLSAVTVADAPNIAVGDVLGSCVFNLAILVVLDAMYRGGSIYRHADLSHVLTAGFGIILIGLAGVSILLARDGLTYRIGHVGAYTPLFVVLYLLAMRSVFVHERREREAFVEQVASRYPDISLATAVKRYLASAGVVAAAGTWLPFVGTELADVMGWQKAFVGTMFVAAVTSLPELVVTLGALRLGALDMAISNLLGSNLFDILILAIDDAAYRKGPLLSAVSPTHAVTALAAIIMTGIVIVALLYRPGTRFLRVGSWISVSLLLVYVLNAYVIFLFGH